MKKLRTFIFYSTGLFILNSCGNSAVENTNEDQSGGQKETTIAKVSGVTANYIAAIKAYRKDKDAGLVSKGIIEADKLPQFKGLQYFEPDSTWVLKAKIELLKPEKVIFKTNDTRAPEYYTFCKLSFERGGEKGVLTAYVEDLANPGSLFIPFRDATAKKETYGGGRYMDLHYQGEKTLILLDFNTAYNPYCHYNHGYSCPLVPAENILTMAINAGEKKLYE